LLTDTSTQQHAQIQELLARRQEDLERMVQLQGQLLAARAGAARVTFVDVRGIGKPSNFTSETKHFASWSFKLGNFLEGLLPGMRGALQWAQEREEAIESLDDLWNVKKLSIREIVQVTGLSRNLVERTVAKNGWPLRRPSKYLTISTEELLDLHSRMSLAQIADHFYISPSTVSLLFKRHNIRVSGGRRSSLLAGDEKEIEKLWKEGKKIREIAEWLGVADHVIAPWVGLFNNRKRTQAYHEKEAENGDLGAPAKDPRTV
jgi:transposase